MDEEEEEISDDEDMLPPGVMPPGIMPPVWGGGGGQGHMWGEGMAMVGEVLNPEENLPHHAKNPKELAGT